MEMMYQLAKSSYQDSLKVLEADIQHANALCMQMVDRTYLHMEGRQQLGISMFNENQIAGIILPSLQRLRSSLGELDEANKEYVDMLNFGSRMKGDNQLSNVDLEREDECGICLEPCTKMVLPNCCHAMCVKCYRNWNTKSESCPFCRGSLKRVNSEDLWVLTCNEDVIDPETVSKEDLLRFYLYINSLPKEYPDALFLVYYEYLI
ncbi:hypothetical protein JRO89_XS05G0104000 [Xanthoceras sorbifolium]|uniref:RING-type domain-containing protein n=1 Tax=Xanthoceras sorbifolium TaxID=99658 RepID=A0ABQ8I1E3_9ROSI|nr:hypothetical protein JRO89_XS05G0104000 [Xanthoceras sorbifolium]